MRRRIPLAATNRSLNLWKVPRPKPRRKSRHHSLSQNLLQSQSRPSSPARRRKTRLRPRSRRNWTHSPTTSRAKEPNQRFLSRLQQLRMLRAQDRAKRKRRRRKTTKSRKRLKRKPRSLRQEPARLNRVLLLSQHQQPLLSSKLLDYAECR